MAPHFGVPTLALAAADRALRPRAGGGQARAIAAGTPRALNREAHEGHADSADLAAACGGEAICERPRPTRRWRIFRPSCQSRPLTDRGPAKPGPPGQRVSRIPSDLSCPASCLRVLRVSRSETSAPAGQREPAWFRAGHDYPRRLKNCTARSCFSAAALEENVPRLRRRRVRGSTFREYRRYWPDWSLRIIGTSTSTSSACVPGHVSESHPSRELPDRT